MGTKVDLTIEMLEQAGKQLGKLCKKTGGHTSTQAVNLLDDIEVAGIRLVRSPSTDVFTSHSVLNAKNEVVGSVRLSIAPDEIQSLCTPAGSYPANWFDEAGTLKPFLEIEQMNTLGRQGEGYGRKIIQAIHNLSKRLGFEGRVSAESAEYAKTFYSKCGFDIPPSIKQHYDELYESCLKIAKEQNLSESELQALLKSKGVPEIINGKYNVANQRLFNPTEENIQLLFPNGLNVQAKEI